MPRTSWRKVAFQCGPYVLVGAECPWCHEYRVPCVYYNGSWHAMREVQQLHKATCAARAEQMRRKRPWHAGRVQGPDAWSAYRIAWDCGPDTPRDELPDELPTNLAAGLSRVDGSQIRRLCISGTLEARKGPVAYGGATGWLVRTDSLISWLEATGRRAPADSA